LPPTLAEEFVAAGAAPPQDVLADLTRLLVRDLTENPPEREEMRGIFELAHSYPAVLAAMLARFDGFQRSIADAVAERLGERPDDEVPSLIAALALAAIRNGLERWTRDEPPTDEDDSPVPYVERSVELLRGLLAA
jgi:hypothetical protein